MSTYHSRLIIVLLCTILAVIALLAELLFGRDELWGTAVWLEPVLVPLFAWLLIMGVFRALKELLWEVIDLRRSGKPWVAEALLFFGMPFASLWVVDLIAKKYHWSLGLSPYYAKIAGLVAGIAGLVWYVVFAAYVVVLLVRWVRSWFSPKSIERTDESFDKDPLTTLAEFTKRSKKDPTLTDGELTDKDFVAPDLSGDLRSGSPIDNHAAVEKLAAQDRKAARFVHADRLWARQTERGRMGMGWWLFEGTGTQLGFSISRSGKLSAYGTCSQSCRDYRILQYVRGIPGEWSLHFSDAAEHEYDPVGRGLKAFFARNEARTAALIDYCEPDKEQPAIVCASIVMPPSVAQETLSLLKAAFGNPQIRYVIGISFLGLMPSDVAPSDTIIPSVAEFLEPDIMKRRGYLSDDVTVRVLAFAPGA